MTDVGFGTDELDRDRAADADATAGDDGDLPPRENGDAAMVPGSRVALAGAAAGPTAPPVPARWPARPRRPRDRRTYGAASPAARRAPLIARVYRISDLPGAAAITMLGHKRSTRGAFPKDIGEQLLSYRDSKQGPRSSPA
jgi:hypothetical protein